MTREQFLSRVDEALTAIGFDVNRNTTTNLLDARSGYAVSARVEKAGEQGLGFRARPLRALHGVADGPLPLLDHAQERVPGQLRHHEGEEREQDEGRPEQRPVEVGEPPGEQYAGEKGAGHRAT